MCISGEQISRDITKDNFALDHHAKYARIKTRSRFHRGAFLRDVRCYLTLALIHTTVDFINMNRNNVRLPIQTIQQHIKLDQNPVRKKTCHLHIKDTRHFY